jgi:hypothetical protein
LFSVRVKSLKNVPRFLLTGTLALLCVVNASAQGTAAKSLTGLAALRVPEGFRGELAAGSDRAPYAIFGALNERGCLYLPDGRHGFDIQTKAMVDFLQSHSG